MTYIEFIDQFPKCRYSDKTGGLNKDKHHIIPRAVQIQNVGRVYDDRCVLLSRKDHYFAHYLYCVDFPQYECEKISFYLMSRQLKYREDLTEEEVLEFSKIFDGWIYEVSDDTKRKISDSLKGHAPTLFHHSEETKKLLSEKRIGENNPFYGKHHSEEYKKKASEKRKGIPRPPEAGEKVSKALKGRTFSEERKRHISEAKKGKCCGEENPHYGKHHSEEAKRKIGENTRKCRTGTTLSEEHKRKISESHKGIAVPTEARKKISESKKGGVFYTNGKISKMFRVGDPIPEGWWKGCPKKNKQEK